MLKKNLVEINEADTVLIVNHENRQMKLILRYMGINRNRQQCYHFFSLKCIADIDIFGVAVII